MLIQFRKQFCQPFMILAAAIFIFSCKKDLNNSDTTDNNSLPDLTTKVTSTVSGYVVDENNVAVLGAAVHAGNTSTTTDKYGYFSIHNADVVKTAASVRITYPGYFNAVKTWSATANKAASFRIKLIPKTIAGAVDATTGGNVALSNGLVIALPANGVVVAADNTIYTGQVNIVAYWINPQATDLTEIMPGDLRGLDNDGLMKGLTTYGMAAVELTGASGQLLQIASGKKATLTMPLSSQLLANAPNSIPLWYFDEPTGLWKEDGVAIKTGSAYIGDVSHFSYWNCDLPNATIPLTFTVIDASGKPMADAHVEITPVPGSTNSWSHVGGYTDSTGYVSVFITPNTSYNLNIYATCNYYGGVPNFSQTFSGNTTPVNLGNIVIANGISTATVSGTATDCNNNPITNGYLIVHHGYYYTRYPIDNTGAYNFAITICNGSLPVELIAENTDSSQQNAPIAYTIVSGTNNIGNIQACGVSTSQFINYSIDGGATYINLSNPEDSIYHSGDGSPNPPLTFIVGNNYSNGIPASPWDVEFSIPNSGIVAGTSMTLQSFNCSDLYYQAPVITNPIDVHITEYGPVGGYIAGHFAGVIGSSVPPYNNYSVVCNFRTKRVF